MNTSNQKKHRNCLGYESIPLSIGIKKEKLNVSEQKEIIEDSLCQKSSVLQPQKQNKKSVQKKKGEYATAVSQREGKKKTLIGRLSSSDVNMLTTKLCTILEAESTSKERTLKPWWTKESKEISKKLWLPTETDYVASVLTSSNTSYPSQMGKSWFSINKKLPPKKNSLMTSFQLSHFSLPDSMDSEVTPLKSKSKTKPLKTLKMRLFPTEEETKSLKLMMEQFRWYYNSTLNIVYNHFGHKEITKKKYFASKIRDLVRKYKYVEEESGRYIFSRFEYDEERNENPVAPWWSSKPHSRISRGAVNKFVSSLNSAISNYKNKNNNGFKMKFRTKKDVMDYINFEDKSFPSMIKNIKSRYWYRTKDKKRKSISFSDIQHNDKGIEIIHDKIKDRYFLHYPVEYDWFPSDDNRNDNQVMSSFSRKQVIALDPGIRKFMVGYDPSGKYIHICNGGCKLIIEKLKEIDKLDSLIDGGRYRGSIRGLKENKYLLWLKIKNMVKELHWKTIKYLTDNYDTILLPDFRVSQMIKKRNISRSTKRMLCMYSFHSFKEKLKYKCGIKNVKLVIVDESFTSKTCGFCGYLNDTRGAEYLKCVSCKKEMDRDESGSRNILLKNLSLR